MVIQQLHVSQLLVHVYQVDLQQLMNGHIVQIFQIQFKLIVVV